MKTFTFVICILLSAIASFATAPASGYAGISANISTTDDHPTVNADPFSVCIEAENSNGTGPITEDPNASNGKTRGAQGLGDYYVDYEASNIQAGKYQLTIRYYAESNATAIVYLNESITSYELPASYSWNIAWKEYSFELTLNEGYNKIRIQQPYYGPGIRQDKICLLKVAEPLPCDFKVVPHTLEVYPVYTPGETMNFNARCTGTACNATSYVWTGNGLDVTGQTISATAPAELGYHSYTLTTSKEGCADVTSTLTVIVQSIPAKCDYQAGPVPHTYTPSCGQGIGIYADCAGFGCLGLQYSWSGPGITGSGNTPQLIAPATNGTFAYALTTSKEGCADKVFNFNLTITDCGTASPEPFSACVEAENSPGDGPITEDPNASNGKTRGAEDKTSYYVNYYINGVKSTGVHELTLRYYATGNAVVSVSANGQMSHPNLSLEATNSWNIVWAERKILIYLTEGSNIIRIQGMPGYSPVRQDRICVTGPGGSGNTSTCNFDIGAQATTLNPACGAVFSLGANCTGSDCASVSYQWNGDGPDQPYQLVDLAAPSVNGSYAYTVTATKNGCSPKTATIHYSVTSCPPAGGPMLACVEAEHSISDGQHTSDPNASNGLTVGVQNNYNYYVDYQVNGLGAGLYPVTLRYYAEADAQVSVSVNGSVAIPALHLPPTYSWNIVWREETFYVTLPGGYNTIRIQGLPGAACRQDKICVGNSQSNARTAAPEFFQTQRDAPLLQAFPNPASGEFKAVFHLKTGAKGSMQITDVQGKIWHSRNVTGKGTHEERINLGNAPAGIYLLQVKKPDSVETKKILLTH